MSFLKDYSEELGNITGISSVVISQIEQQFKLTLPLAYKQFLQLLGESTGSFMKGYYMNYPYLLDNKQDADCALNFDNRKHNIIIIKDQYFFFGQWQGYNFFYFDCSEESEDPPVYVLTDTPKTYQYKSSFTTFLREEGLTPLLESKSKFQ